jgi:hypothetical protein
MCLFALCGRLGDDSKFSKVCSGIVDCALPYVSAYEPSDVARADLHGPNWRTALGLDYFDGLGHLYITSIRRRGVQYKQRRSRSLEKHIWIHNSLATLQSIRSETGYLFFFRWFSCNRSVNPLMRTGGRWPLKNLRYEISCKTPNFITSSYPNAHLQYCDRRSKHAWPSVQPVAEAQRSIWADSHEIRSIARKIETYGGNRIGAGIECGVPYNPVSMIGIPKPHEINAAPKSNLIHSEKTASVFHGEWKDQR